MSVRRGNETHSLSVFLLSYCTCNTDTQQNASTRYFNRNNNCWTYSIILYSTGHYRWWWWYSTVLWKSIITLNKKLCRHTQTRTYYGSIRFCVLMMMIDRSKPKTSQCCYVVDGRSKNEIKERKRNERFQNHGVVTNPIVCVQVRNRKKTIHLKLQ